MSAASAIRAAAAASVLLALTSCATLELYDRMPAAQESIGIDPRAYDGEARTEVERFVDLIGAEVVRYNSIAERHNDGARTSRAWALGNGIASATAGAISAVLSLTGNEGTATTAAGIGSIVVGLSITIRELSGLDGVVSRASRTAAAERARIDDALEQFRDLSPRLRTPDDGSSASFEARDVAIRDLRRLDDRLATLVFAPTGESDDTD